MRKAFSKEDIRHLQQSIEHLKKYSRVMFGISIIVIFVSITILLILQAPLDYITACSFSTLVICISIWYYVFGNSLRKLKTDRAQGVKQIDAVTVLETKRDKKGEKEYVLSNGFIVNDLDFRIYNEDDSIANPVQVGQQLMIAYTPYERMIVGIQVS